MKTSKTLITLYHNNIKFSIFAYMQIRFQRTSTRIWNEIERKNGNLNKHLPSYLHRTFLFFSLTDKGFSSAFRTFFRTIRPSHFFLNRLLVWSFNFSSFYKLGHLLSLNLAKGELLTVFCVGVCVAQFFFFWTFCVTCAALAPTKNKKQIS